MKAASNALPIASPVEGTHHINVSLAITTKREFWSVEHAFAMITTTWSLIQEQKLWSAKKGIWQNATVGSFT